MTSCLSWTSRPADQLGRLYNIEMQMVGGHHFPSAVRIYSSILYGQQLREGDEYADLRNNIDQLRRQRPLSTGGGLSPGFSASQFATRAWYLATSNRCMCWNCRNSPRRLASWPIHWICGVIFWFTGRLDPNNLPGALRKSAMERAMEVLKMMSQTDLERERYLARVKVAQ